LTCTWLDCWCHLPNEHPAWAAAIALRIEKVWVSYDQCRT
jgi:hypothetical protein